MKRILRSLLAASALLCLGVAARAGEASPNAGETKWIADCLATHDMRDDAQTACVGKLMAGCVNAEMPKGVTASDRNGHPRGCAWVEEKIWDGQLNTWYAAAQKAINVEAKEKLREAQRAWLAYRAARCAVEYARNHPPLGDDNASVCAMEETARRALELREMAQEGGEP